MCMNQKTWYYWAMGLPIIWPFFLMFLTDIGLVPGVIRIFNSVFLAGAMAAGIQYALFVMGVYWWSKYKSADQMRAVSWRMPLYFFPVCAAGLLIFFIKYSGQHDSFLQSLLGILLISSFVIPVGYFYVFMVHALTKLFIAWRWIKD